MKITDLKASATTAVGDTILSSNDMSNKYIDRTNEQTLNKLEYPKLWETYKQSTGDRFVDRRVTDLTASGQYSIDFIETENSYMFLDLISTVNFKFFNKSMNVLSNTSFPSITFSLGLRMTGDNDCVVVYTNNSSAFYYSNNFNIDNQEIGTFTSKTMPGPIRNITFINDYFIIEQVYTGIDSIIYKINKNELNKLDLITGVFATDKLLEIVLFDYETFIITNNLGLTSLASNVGQDVTFLENGDIFLYCNTDKIVAKTNQSNPYFLEIYENLNGFITTGNIVSTNSYKNSFIMTFKKITSTSDIIILINDNGLKIKHDSLTNTNILKNITSAEVFFIDFINKKLILGYNTNLGFYNSFSMNNVKKDAGQIFNLVNNPLNVQFNSVGSSNQKTTKNKNPIFMTLKNTFTQTMENGSNQYDTFRADFTLGEFPDNFTMPAIIANEKDKYWTKKG